MEKYKCCEKCEYIDKSELYCGNKDCSCHTPVTESEVCENPNCYCGAKKHKCECKQGASDMCKYCHLPPLPEEKDLVDWEEEFDKIEIAYTTKHRDFTEPLILDTETEITIKEFISNLLSSNTERVKKDLFRKIKDYDFKENHLCRFNDGECDCQCFIQGLNVALNYINNIK